ncbi:MAG TPA: ATP-binding protein [Candidatus Mediterraneibacter cottocaccae]|nr:ATP-binding protein [Candidatus Mediterraneibacter cottocaccae]
MNVGERKKLPIGIENFSKIRDEGFYYVDKTGMIRDLLNRWGEVNLFTRPRRFGKSLNMSMLKAFFEIGCDRTLFDGLEIAGEEKLCEEYMGKFPVISVSLKSVDGADYETARALLCGLIGNEAMRFSFLLESDRITAEEKETYRQLITVDPTGQSLFSMSDPVLMGSLKTLSELLHKHYGTKVIILIDEYDVPLSKANERGYYGSMVSLIRGMFEQALKTNDSLHFAVLTGCLRVAKESIFTGLNNPKILSITTLRFDEYFGFTDDEVRKMLEYYGLERYYGEIKEWYDGYRFGNVDVYCPWDVINYCDELLDDPEAQPRDYWSNTSGNEVVRHFLENVGNGLTKSEIEALTAGETVTKEIHEELTYNHLYDSVDHVWSVLFMTGYLTQRGKPDGKRYNLTIPNREIRNIFTEQIMVMFRENVARDGEMLHAFCSALENGDAGEVERLFADYLKKTVGIRDTFVRKPTKENFYHGILLGILGFKNGWYVKSNRESGDGYSDIMIRIEDEDIGIIIEVKYAENAALEEACRDALEQIETKEYEAELEAEGCREVLKYGIACFRKKCRVMVRREAKSIY